MFSVHFGHASPAKAAAMPLTTNEALWQHLRANSSALCSLRDTISLCACRWYNLSAEESAKLNRQMDYLLRAEDNFDPLHQAMRMIIGSSFDECHDKWDGAKRGSMRWASVIVLEAIVAKFSAASEGGFVNPLPPAGCALCGLTMRCEAPPGDAPQLDAPRPPTAEADGGDIRDASTTRGREYLASLLAASALPPARQSGWVQWNTLLPCGHLIHQHCLIKVAACRADASEVPTCPQHGCGREWTRCSSAWWYGRSGTHASLAWHDAWSLGTAATERTDAVGSAEGAVPSGPMLASGREPSAAPSSP